MFDVVVLCSLLCIVAG